jgi:hypothetical protein
MSDEEQHYYVLNAQGGTKLSVTLTNTEAPSCDTLADGHCGVVEAVLENTAGHQVDRSDFTEPIGGVAGSASFVARVESGGTYYVAVCGFPGIDAGKSLPVSYTLSVSTSHASKREHAVARAGGHGRRGRR